ncbi:hypothetical protein pb186bvf_005819 [Paramecium bursaria]
MYSDDKAKSGNSIDFDWLAKVIIIGDSGVGKTNILSQFCEQKFSVTHTATLGVDFKVKTIDVEGKKIKLQVWDTAGQERFKTITKTYYKGSHGVILTYSVIDKQSYDNVENWLRSILENTQDVHIILVGNKCDKTEERQVSFQEGERIAKNYSIPFFETSARSGQNIKETFDLLGKKIKDTLVKRQLEDNQNQEQGQQIRGDKKQSGGKKEACC